MSVTWMRSVGQAGASDRLVVEQLVDLKLALRTALDKRDWPSVCRIDRLSAQIVSRLVPNDKTSLAEIVSELTAIKTLYQQSIGLIEKELIELANQAY